MLPELGIRLEDVAARLPEAVSDGNLRPAGWCGHDSVLGSRELSRIVRAGLDCLYDAQNGDGELSVVGDAVQDGRRRVTIRREGTGSLYWSVELRYFTQEEDVKGSSNGVSVTREYARLTPRAVKRAVEGKELTELVYDGQPLVAGEELASGEEVEVRLSLEAENEYEYLLVEDPKPAGCEPVDVRSGERYGGGLCSNVELRDTKVAFFLTRLPRGSRTLTYKLRAEVPGRFHCLPTRVEAMYAPSVNALADEARLSIVDRAREAGGGGGREGGSAGGGR